MADSEMAAFVSGVKKTISASVQPGEPQGDRQ
jgi:hypothetical protein